MSYVITAISHSKSIAYEQFVELQGLIETFPVKVKSITTLSDNRVFDFNITLITSESQYSRNDEVTTLDTIREGLLESGTCKDIDLVLQRNDEYRRNKKLFVFDMDSTLITQEVIELIAAYAGVEKEVEKVTTLAMNGELDFKQSLAKRVALLRGIDANIWTELEKKLEFTKGARELAHALRKIGCKLAVLSGGFIPLARFVQKTLGLDYAYANTLATEVVDGHEVFNGATIGDIVDGCRKAELLEEIANKESIPLKAAVAVGDGANDLKMMSVAGFGIAWNAKPKVQKLAPSKLNTDSLLDILYILGYKDEEIEKLIK